MGLIQAKTCGVRPLRSPAPRSLTITGVVMLMRFRVRECEDEATSSPGLHIPGTLSSLGPWGISRPERSSEPPTAATI